MTGPTRPDDPGPDDSLPDDPLPDDPRPEDPAPDDAAPVVPIADVDPPAPGDPVPVDPVPADPVPADTGTPGVEEPAPWRRGRRDRKAAVFIGVLTLLLGFAFTVQVRNSGTDESLAGQREEDLVGILDDLTAQEDRLRQEIADQRTLLDQLGNTDSQSATALEGARERAEALGVLNGSIAATGPGLTLTITDPTDRVSAATVLDAVQELRGAGAETMQIDDVRVGVSTAVTGSPGALEVDGKPVTAPYTFVVIGSPQDLETAMAIPGGVESKVGREGGVVRIEQSDAVVVDALRPLDDPEYAQPAD